ncbi:hypothetical protein EVAR_97910_1 [Eumeta japonica]|uniref:Uncharacterized protein n=1 Tax=Eumeta variegata TaxID=151549 RepID=A0A4C2AA64_EUMVA|nr:hypothetical protein EVAR_97910_1 [Eumeta japonica]
MFGLFDFVLERRRARRARRAAGRECAAGARRRPLITCSFGVTKLPRECHPRPPRRPRQPAELYFITIPPDPAIVHSRFTKFEIMVFAQKSSRHESRETRVVNFYNGERLESVVCPAARPAPVATVTAHGRIVCACVPQLVSTPHQILNRDYAALVANAMRGENPFVCLLRPLQYHRPNS